jgi:O-acetyl-ADP-ribose deacetylase (regulator of RNase III)
VSERTQAKAVSAIDVRVDDLVFATGDAIAWPVSAELKAVTPLLRRLEAAGGRALAAQLRAQEPLPVGSAVVTGAGDLGVELLISAVVSSDTEPVSRGGVRRALTSALHRAGDWQIEQLVCTPFGLGAGNLDIEESADLMVRVMTQHVVRARFPSRITVIVETPLEHEVFLAVLARQAK